MSYTMEAVRKEASRLRVIMTDRMISIDKPYAIRFHGKNGKAIEVEGSDNAMSFLKGIEYATGFKHTIKDMKDVSKIIRFDPDGKNMLAKIRKNTEDLL